MKTRVFALVDIEDGHIIAREAMDITEAQYKNYELDLTSGINASFLHWMPIDVLERIAWPDDGMGQK